MDDTLIDIYYSYNIKNTENLLFIKINEITFELSLLDNNKNYDFNIKTNICIF